jgi:hypothetical protein
MIYSLHAVKSTMTDQLAVQPFRNLSIGYSALIKVTILIISNHFDGLAENI